jgi:hypothetical protein
VNNLPGSYQSGAAAGFVDDRLAEGRVSFALDELQAETGLSQIAARHQLLRLGERVVRVSPRQPYFLIVAPEHRSLGAPPVDRWLDDYMAWLVHPYYLALQSAAAAWGASPQAIQETQVITDIPRREIVLGRLRIRFFMKTAAALTPTGQCPGAFAPLHVSTPEATVFDLVRYAHNLGGIGRMAETIVPLLPKLKAGALQRMLVAENETATAQRLGFMLAALGAPALAAVVHEWLPATRQKILLALQADDDRSAPFSGTWGVIDNTRCFS